MNYTSQLIFAILTFSQAITIYPNLKSQNFQWEDQIWMDCKTEKLIVPTNCENNDQNWQECYEIPEQGLCLKNELKILQHSTYNLIFNFQNLNNKVPQIFLNDNNYEQKSFQNNKIVIQTILNQSNLNIKILGVGAKLQKFSLTSDCNLNCQQCNGNFECTQCFNDFSMINYQCIPDTCFETLGDLTTESAQNANSLIDQKGEFQVTVDFNVELGQCLVPKVYLINEIISNKIEFTLARNQIYLKSKKQLFFYLTLDQINEYCKIIVQNKEKNIRQCSLGVALTTAQITQYNLILLGEITTNLQTSSSISSTQVINIPENGKVQLEVSNEITNVQINEDVLTITQKIYNDDLKIDNINLREAYLVQNGQQYDSLDFLVSFVKGQLITYKFKIKETHIKFDQYIDLVLTSELIQQRRILTQDRSQLKIGYNAKNSIQFLPNELLQLNQNNNSTSTVKYQIYAITAILLLSLCATAVWYSRKEKKHFEVGEEITDKNN
ncbi:unnamed protein product [Paramecium sonneborni]|uniref:Transmembrane protein n=1 Tax=Paramecium sonneborni TaxID=65129 RepID=A0A8S1QYH1_9CILI|nr:unnamed protein product [Paramecium sonneborni]